MLFVFIFIQVENQEKMQEFGTEVSQGATRVELNCYSEEFSSCNESFLCCSTCNLDRKGKNPCFLTVARILLTVAQKHRANSAKSLETQTKSKKKKGGFLRRTTKGGNLERETKKKLIFLRILTKIRRKTQDSKL